MTNSTQLALLRDRLSYDHLSGHFTWRDGPKAGSRAGSRNAGGYILIRAKVASEKVAVYAHRLAWAVTHGEWPEQIDHINRRRADNRIENLRASDARRNAWNTEASGCYLHACGRWHSTIRAPGGRISLGYFDSKADAMATYQKAKAKHHAQ
jgi:hypothetical protein